MSNMNHKYIFLGFGGLFLVLIFVVGIVVARPDQGTAPIEEITIEESYESGTGPRIADTTVNPKPTYQTQGCTWKWYQIRDIGLWAEECVFNGMRWGLSRHADGDKLDLVIGGKVERVAVQVFQKPSASSIESIVPQIGVDAPKACLMQKNDAQSTETRTVYEFAPTGALKRTFETSKDIPEDPCGPFGISASGQRIFEVWEGHENTVIFLNYGQDGSLFEYETLTFIR